ncbi:MAG TPA: histone deacetylase, partial [Candidatus Caenarcaniphilales bacterium]
MLPIIYADEFLLHDTGAYHPECPARLQAIVHSLKSAPWADKLSWRSPTPVTQRNLLPELQQVHTSNYIEKLQHLANQGGGYLDPDTPVSPQSYEVALLAVSAWLDGTEQVLATGKPVFVLARPPGHHAFAQSGMGFCLFSNAALAAYHALAQPGVKRVAILDWDVHHGNGTQAIVESHPQIAYCSIHQGDFYPGTGAADEHGAHQNVLNLPVAAGSTRKDYQPLFQQQILPFLAQFQPDLLIVSA